MLWTRPATTTDTAAGAFSRGWQRLCGALVGGGVLSLTLAPLSFWPGLFGYALLLGVLLAADRERRRPLERFWLGAAFGFAFHLAGLWWVGMAFLVDTAAHGALLPLGVVGLPLLLAPFHGLAGWLAGLGTRAVVPRIFALAAAVTLTEALRGVVLTGFPWNTPGAQIAASLEMAQGVGLLGLEGMALPAVLMGAALALIWARSTWAALATGAFVLALGSGLYAYGAWRLAAPEPRSAEAPIVRIVQPNIPQAQKWDPAERARIWSTLLRLTETPADRAPVLVVWPETAFPFFYRVPSVEQAELSFALPDGATLLAGAVEVEERGGSRRALNSVYVIDGDGVPLSRYDKVKLVPFGEFLPLRALLSSLGLSRLVGGASEFVAGPKAVALATPLGPLQPLVCYEVIFPRFKPRDEIGVVALANLTNDAWFGDTPGPHQHLRLAQLRAIQSGMPVIRSANTGISAVIDGRGRTLERLSLGERGVIDTALPPIEPPVGARFGWLAGLCFWVMAAVVGWGSRPGAKITLRLNVRLF